MTIDQLRLLGEQRFHPADRVSAATQSLSMAFQLVPSAAGGVRVCFSNGDRHGYIEASNDGELTAVFYSKTYDPKVTGIESDDQLRGVLVQIRDFIK